MSSRKSSGSGQINKVTKRAVTVAAQVLLFCCITSAQGVPTTAPAPKPNLTAPGPQAHQPPARQQSGATNLGIAKPPTPPLVHMVGQGVITGYVYWDTKSVTHNPATSCSGLGTAVSVGTPPKGSRGFEQFKLLGTYHNFTYIESLGSLVVCEYVVKQVPVGQDLQVQVNFKQPSFTPAITAAIPPTANNPNQPINIGGGNCNKLPPAVPSTSVLGSGWWTCGNNAYNVNFVLQPATAANMGNGGGQITLLNSNSPGVSPTGSQVGLLAGGNASRGMLNGGTNPGPQNSLGGSLKGGVNPGPIGTPTGGALPAGINPGPINTPSNSQSGTPGQLLPAKPGGGTVQLNPQPYPPKGTTISPGGNANNVQLNPQPYPPKGSSQVGGGNGGNVSLNPQPFPPKGTSAVLGNKQTIPAGQGSAAGKVALKPVTLPAPTALRKATNPTLAQQNASIIAVLDEQRLAAQQDSAAMKSSLRSAATARTATVATNFQGNMPASGLAPSQTQSAPANSLSSITHLQPFNSVVLVCSMDTTPRILRVNGGQAPGIFTPEAKYNQYTIVGCSFGQAQGTAHVYGQNGFSANLNIDYWSNNGITAHLDPSLAGVLDQNNVTLVVVPPEQQQIQKSGYRFYAARGMPLPDGTDQEVQLAYDSMPRTNAGPFDIPNLMLGFDQLPSNAGSNFSSFTFSGTSVAGWIFRYGYSHCDRMATGRTADCYVNGNVPCNAGACNQFLGVGAMGSYLVGTKWMPWPLKSDTWDFNKLAPGFQISDYQLFVSTLDPKTLCGAWDDMSHDGYFDADWAFNLSSQNQITVTWAVNRCDDQEFGTRDNMAVQSAYGLAVWVMGPRCIDAWTGQKNQSCMVKVKQILG